MTTVKIIAEWDAKHEAYNRGYSRFLNRDLVDIEEYHFSQFTETAEWANTVAPDLRAMAGYDDRGHGTYQQEPEAIVLVEEPEDEPAEGELLDDPWYFLDELVECFNLEPTTRRRGPTETHRFHPRCQPKTDEGPLGPDDARRQCGTTATCHLGLGHARVKLLRPQSKKERRNRGAVPLSAGCWPPRPLTMPGHPQLWDNTTSS